MAKQEEKEKSEKPRVNKEALDKSIKEKQEATRDNKLVTKNEN